MRLETVGASSARSPLLPRPVEVLHAGGWVRGTLLSAYRSDGRWRGVVRYSVQPGEQYQQARWAEELRPMPDTERLGDRCGGEDLRRGPASRKHLTMKDGSVFLAENLALWRDADVIDPSDGKIGSLESIYVDTVTDEPAFAGVKVGIVGRHRIAFVPLHAATVGPKFVRVRYDKDLAKNAPGIETSGELAADLEPAIFAHYGLAYETTENGARRLARR